MLSFLRAARVWMLLAAASCSGSVQSELGAATAGGSGAGGGDGGVEACDATFDRPCYGGPAETQWVGVCRGGWQRCHGLDGWGACELEVTPSGEVCSTTDDESCNGDGACTGELQWAQAGGDAGSHGGMDVAVDAAGDVLLTGRLIGGLEIGGEALSADDYQAFVMKLGRDGGALWSLVVDGGSEGSAVAADAAGNVFVAGGFHGTVELGGETLVSAGASDVFLAKLDAGGRLLWARRVGGGHDEWVSDIVVDSAGHVIVVGGFEASTDLGGGKMTAAGEIDVLVLALDQDGSPLWQRTFGSAGYDYALGMAIGGEGEIALAGSFDGTIDLGGGPLVSEDEDAFVVALGPGGEPIWSRRVGGAGHDLAYAVGFGPAGDIVVGGLFSDAIEVGGEVLAAEGAYDGFVARWELLGEPMHAVHVGGPDGSAYVTRLVVDGAGNTVAFGTLNGTVALGETTITAAGAQGSSGPEDLWLLKLDPAGQPAWHQRFGGPARERAYGLAVAPTGEVVITGDFQGTVDFGNGPLSAPAESGWGLYLAKLAH